MIGPFRGKYRFLSNFFTCEVLYDGIPYRTTEHAYQASKTDNPIWQAVILAAETPGEAKKIGQQVNMRTDFEAEKVNIMLNLLRQKFRKPELRGLLMVTGRERLVEFNTWHDNFWGHCTCLKCHFEVKQNNLGKLLMQVRRELDFDRECVII